MNNRSRFSGDEEFNFWPVYADLAMVLVLIFFLFMLAQLVIAAYVDESSETRRRMLEMQETIEEEFRTKKGVEPLIPDGAKQTFIFSADVLFEPDKAELRPQGRELMADFGHSIFRFASFYDRIEVEGHADSARSRVFYRQNLDLVVDHGNWRLSAERAVTVVQFLQGLKLTEKERIDIGKQLAVVGRSYYGPAVFPEVTDADREKNRRIVVTLSYSEKKISDDLKRKPK